MTDTPPPADPQQIIQILTTEHYTLQGGRASTISDANGRASLFLSSVSSGLVALAFVGQVNDMDSTFYAFALVLFPTLLFLGLVTFVRLLETGIEDALYARGIARIRHYYTQIAPQINPYFVLPINDDIRSASGGTMGLFIPGLQILLTSAGTISVINGVLAGVFVAMLEIVLFAPSMPVLLISGAIVFVILVALQTIFQRQQWAHSARTIKPLFPAEGSASGSDRPAITTRA